MHEREFPGRGDGVISLILRISLDPQWELSLESLIPHLEEGLRTGLVQESEVDEVVMKTAILPHLHVETEER